MKKFLLSFSFLCCLFSLSPQVEMRKWKVHLAYNSATQLTQSDNKIYAISSGMLFSVDKTFGEMETYSKVNGLNGSVISCMRYDATTRQLLVLYDDGNIDAITEQGIRNIPDYYNKDQTISKEVRDIFFHEKKAYLSTHFGILAVNMDKLEVADAYYMGKNSSPVAIIQTAVHNQTIYALSDLELYKAPLSSNLVNYENWSVENSLPGSGPIQSVTVFAGSLFLMRGNAIYRSSDGVNWSNSVSHSKRMMKVSGGRLLAHAENRFYYLDEQGQSEEILLDKITHVRDVEYDPENKIYWIADEKEGLASYDGSNLTFYKPSGPIMAVPDKVVFAGNRLFALPGKADGNDMYRYPGHVMIYENGSWHNILQREIMEKTGRSAHDFVDVAVDPSDPRHFFVTSFANGLYEFKNDAFHFLYASENSPLENIIGPSLVPNDYTWIYGTVLDEESNLWVLNSLANKSLKALSRDGKWTEFDYAPIKKMKVLNNLFIPSKNPTQKWITSNWGAGTVFLFVLDNGGSPLDANDDTHRVFSYFNYGGETPLVPQRIYSIAQDTEGVIWLGTSHGPLLFHNVDKVLSPDYNPSRVKIPRNDGTDQADYLLEEEPVRAIVVDAANRKWLGTETSGVYLLSANGQEIIHHFTAQNSPLLSNKIFSIAINSTTGEVFFATEKGLVSYQSDAAGAANTFSDVYVYPNPVREDYKGIITIAGLMKNTQVKITDLHGNLICETVSNGGIATWDGKNRQGRKVSTGIYLAICVNEDGSQSAVSKIMVIN